MKSEAVQMLSSAALFSSAFLIPLILVDEWGVPESAVGLVVAAYAAAVLASSWAFGRLADVRGRRRVLQFGLLACVVASALQFFARTPEALTAVRIVMGICAGTFPSALMAYVYESRGHVGKLTSFGAAGWVVGTLFGGYVAVYSLFAPFLLSTALFSMAFAISLVLKFPKEMRVRVPIFPVNVIKRNAATYIPVLIRHSGANMVWVIYAIFLSGINPDPMWIGMVYVINSGTQFVLMQLLDPYGGRRLLAIGLALSALTFLLFTRATSEWHVMAAQVVLAASWSCTYVGAMKCILQGGVERSTSSGLMDSTLSLSAIIGSITGGVIASMFGHVATMFAAMLMSLAALAIFGALVINRASGVSIPSSGRAS
ncbi:MAG: MFS transporter [Methanobacteriota archaeon]